MFCAEAEDGVLELNIHPALDTRNTSAERGQAAGMAQYARLLEGYIRCYPGQYRNWHSVAPAGT